MLAVSEKITDILSDFIEKDRDVRFVVVTDDQGLTIGAYPFSEEKVDLIETIGAVFSDLLQQVLEVINEKTPKIAGKVVRISVGIKTRVIEFYSMEGLNIIIFKRLDVEEH